MRELNRAKTDRALADMAKVYCPQHGRYHGMCSQREMTMSNGVQRAIDHLAVTEKGWRSLAKITEHDSVGDILRGDADALHAVRAALEEMLPAEQVGPGRPAKVDCTSDERTSNNVMRHEYRVLNEQEKRDMKIIKDMGFELHRAIESLGPSREVSLAKTKVEEAIMWAVKGITG